MNQVRWLGTYEVARLLNYNQNYVLRLIERGDLPAVKTGPAQNSRYRITEQNARDYLARREAEKLPETLGNP